MPASARQQRAVTERRARVLQLRAAGATFQQIADSEHLATASAAVMDVKRALAARRKELAEVADAHVMLELERLDAHERAAQNVLRAAAAAGPAHDPSLVLRAIDRLTRISARRCALLGLDDDSKDRKSSPLGTVPGTKDEIAAKRRDRRARAAAAR
jgi:hypothetical protein